MLESESQNLESRLATTPLEGAADDGCCCEGFPALERSLDLNFGDGDGVDPAVNKLKPLSWAKKWESLSELLRFTWCFLVETAAVELKGARPFSLSFSSGDVLVSPMPESRVE